MSSGADHGGPSREAKRRAPASELVEARLVDLLLRHERWRDLAGVFDGFAEKVPPQSGVRHRLAAARILLDRAGDRRGAEVMLRSAMTLADRGLSEAGAIIPGQLTYAELDGRGLAGAAALSRSTAPLLDLASMARDLGNTQLRVDALRVRALTSPEGPAQWRALMALAAAERDAGDLDAAEFTLTGVVEALRAANVKTRDSDAAPSTSLPRSTSTEPFADALAASLTEHASIRAAHHAVATSAAHRRHGIVLDKPGDGAFFLRTGSIAPRLHELISGLTRDRGAFALSTRFLEALHAVLPEDRTVTYALVRAYRESGDTFGVSRLPDAAHLLRGLLDGDPLDLEHIAALADVDAAGEGPRAAALFLGQPGVAAPELSRIAGPLELRVIREHLLHPAVRAPLGELLWVTSRALAGLLQPGWAALGERLPAVNDARISDLVQELEVVVGRPVQVLIDPEGAHQVAIEPGDPPVIVVGEALVADAPAGELRFHLARAAMSIELGYLFVERGAGTPRRDWMALLLAAVDPDGGPRVAPEHAPIVEALRGRLSPEDLAHAQACATRLRAEATSPEHVVGPAELGPWAYGVACTADRFGLLAGGDLELAARAMRRSDPRTVAERFDTPEARRASVERSTPLYELLRFILGADYAALLGEGRRGALDTSGRF